MTNFVKCRKNMQKYDKLCIKYNKKRLTFEHNWVMLILYFNIRTLERLCLKLIFTMEQKLAKIN